MGLTKKQRSVLELAHEGRIKPGEANLVTLRSLQKRGLLQAEDPGCRGRVEFWLVTRAGRAAVKKSKP